MESESEIEFEKIKLSLQVNATLKLENIVIFYIVL